ncbi:phenylacetate-coenzyme A ligase PaaK [Candidatus Denitrolinea symbiosum]|jgi:phenylacetate-CoA ligase|nr:phenylacetate-coenzyme A ligase PaaK [Candidatus Denitrolinea symbiosum]
MPDLLSIYHRLPYPLRDLAASLRGCYLGYWRYTAKTESLISEYLSMENWSDVKRQAWVEEKIAFVLHRAATQTPYYREQWDRRRRQGDKASWQYLENWPTLSKETLRAAPKQFIADDCDIHKMYHEHTSGTTGKSLDLWWSRETVRNWYALFEARCRRWHGVSRHDRWAILGGQLVTPVYQRQPPFWVWNAGLNQLYMSSYHLAPNFIPAYLGALQKYKIAYLWGYTSSLYALAVQVLRQNCKDLQMQVVLTNAEPLESYQRTAIEEAFKCPVRETYGMAEIVASASECEYGKMHLWPEVGHVEVMRENSPVPLGETGELICTGIFNVDMPLIRYRVGDEGSLNAVSGCACGRSLPLLGKIHGRVDDVLYTADGRRIGRLDPVFKAHLPVIEAQIIQEELDKLTVRFVPAPEYRPNDGQSIIERLQARVGNVQVKLEPVDEIPREANGKFRAVVSKIAPPNAK